MSQTHPSDISVFQIDAVNPPVPAAGANLVYVFPMPRVEILTVVFSLVTSVVAANRYATVQFLGAGASELWHSPCPVAHIANTTHRYIFTRGIFPEPAVLSPSGTTPLGFGTNLISPIAPQVEITIINIQAADQIAAIGIYAAVWPDPEFDIV